MKHARPATCDVRPAKPLTAYGPRPFLTRNSELGTRNVKKEEGIAPQAM
jgi:hypothetical protein